MIRKALREWLELLAEALASCPPRPGHPASAIWYYENGARDDCESSGRQTGMRTPSAAKRA